MVLKDKAYKLHSKILIKINKLRHIISAERKDKNRKDIKADCEAQIVIAEEILKDTVLEFGLKFDSNINEFEN